MTTKALHRKNASNTGGFTLVETLIYIVLLVILVTTIVTIASSLLRTFSHLSTSEHIAESAIVSLERMTREIQRADAVDLVGSTLGSHPGRLSLVTTDLGGSPAVVAFSLSGGRIMYQLNAGATSPLTNVGVTVTNLEFTRVQNANTEAVRIEMTAESTAQGDTISKDFRTFIVLDNS